MHRLLLWTSDPSLTAPEGESNGITVVSSEEQVLAELDSGDWDLLLVDRGAAGTDLCHLLKTSTVPVVVADDGMLKPLIGKLTGTGPRGIQLEDLFRNSPDAVLAADGDGRYTYANPAAGELLGCATGELIGKRVADVVASEDADHKWGEFQKQGRMRGVISLMRPDGSVRLAEFGAFANFLPGQHVSILRDVTDQEKEVSSLIESCKMEALGRLSRRLAHDFNNLLTVINGYSELLLADGSLSEQAATLVKAVADAGERASRLTGILMEIRGRTPWPQEATEVVSLLRGKGEEWAVIAPPGINIRVHAPRQQDLELLARIAPEALSKVLDQLFHNACEAMPDGGEVQIRARRVSGNPAQEPEPQSLIVVEVSDTGAGMDELVRGRMFEPFFTTKDRARHTGMGLTSAFGIVFGADGQIDVDSRPGKGSRISIVLKESEGPAQTAVLEHAGSLPEPATGRRILLVDDEDAVRRLVRMSLERMGFGVLEASSPGAAIEMWSSNGADIGLILTDVVMPGMTGAEMVRRLRETRQDVPVVYMSGYTEHVALEPSAPGLGPLLVRKPFTSESLQATIARLFQA